MRPSWDSYFLLIALGVATRADCSRRKVGAVIVDEEHRIVSTGYNGSFPNGPSCLAGECPRAKSGVPPDSSYDTGPGACIAIHAEMNAILFADRERLAGSVMYLTHSPCPGCLKHILNTPIAEIKWPEGGKTANVVTASHRQRSARRTVPALQKLRPGRIRQWISRSR